MAPKARKFFLVYGSLKGRILCKDKQNARSPWFTDFEIYPILFQVGLAIDEWE